MNMSRLGLMVLVGLCVSGMLYANTPSSVTIVSASQRTDGTGIVDIYYTLTDPDSPYCTITVTVSNNGGSNYTIAPSVSSLSGDIGQVTPGGGTKHILWYSKQTLPGEYGTNYRVRVCAEDHGVMRPIPVSHFLRVPPDTSFSSYTYQMGDHFGDGSLSEHPVHTVTVDDFYMCKYEVTNEQYNQFLNAALAAGNIFVDNYTVYAADDTSRLFPYIEAAPGRLSSNVWYTGDSFSWVVRTGKDTSNHPVVWVSWYGAKAFCDFYGYRLPTEAEWEGAARDGNHYFKYPWGSNAIDNSKCNYNYRNPMNFYGPPGTTPVGYYGEVRFSDMAGNVAEWVNDWYSNTYYSTSPENNPIGPTTGQLRVLRGGAWFSNAINCRLSSRNFATPPSRGDGVGFRACVSPSSLLSAKFCAPSAVFPINNATLSIGFSSISTQQAEDDFNVTLTVKNQSGHTQTSYNGTVQLYANGGPQLDKTHVTLKNGVWNGTLRLNSPAHSVSIIAASGSISGTSNTFSVTSPTGKNGRIEGTCVDIFNQPITASTLTVVLYQGSSIIRTTSTNTATGKFSFADVPPGNYWIKSDGAKDLLITVDPGRTTAVNLVMSTIPLPGFDKRVVILVPGIMGSANKGVSVSGSLNTKLIDIEFYDRANYVGWDKLTTALHDKGYIVDRAPWDWRREIDETTVDWYLKSVIDDNKQKHNVQKVDIIAHSAGGLLTRYYIQSNNYDQRNDIDKFAMIGTPTGGASPDPYYLWYGADIALIVNSVKKSFIHNICSDAMGRSRLLNLWRYDDKGNLHYEVPQKSILESIHSQIPGLQHLMLLSYQFKRQQSGSWIYADYPYANSLLTYHLATHTNKQRLIPGSNQSPNHTQVRTRLFLSKSESTSLSIPVNAIDHSRELYPLGEPLEKPEKLKGDGTVAYDAAFAGLSSGVHYDCVDNISGAHAKLPGIYRFQVRDFLEQGRIPLGTLSTQAMSDEIRAMDLEEISEEMSIVFSSRIQPLVTSSNGQRLGILPDTGDVIEEINGNVLIYPQYTSTTLTNPSEGEYLLQFSGYAGEVLHIDATLYNQNDDDFVITKKTVLANTGMNQLRIIVDKSQPSPIQIEGLVSNVNNLKAQPEGGLVQLTWDAPNDDRVVGYRVYALPESMQFFQLLNQTTETHLNTGHSWREDDETAFWSYIVLSLDENGNESIVDYNVNNYDLLIARFTSGVVTGKAPLTVSFADGSSGNPTAWEWDFDADGVVDSTEQNPVWTYNEPGVYTVTLKVESETGSDSTIRTTYIDVKKDVGNLLGFIAVWLSQDCSDPTWCKGYDYNESGSVDLADFAIFAENWFGDTISADINMSGHVNFLDFSILSSRWMNENCEQSAWCNGADLDRSGTVDILDLLIFAEHWLEGVSP